MTDHVGDAFRKRSEAPVRTSSCQAGKYGVCSWRLDSEHCKVASQVTAHQHINQAMKGSAPLSMADSRSLWRKALHR